MVIILLCQSINFSNIGLDPKQSATWPKLSGLLNFTANSSHILNFKLLLFVHSPQNLSTPKPLHPTWSAPAHAALDDIKQAIPSNPCLKRSTINAL
jgi:hypothetical protein